jgi:hypothetical protein
MKVAYAGPSYGKLYLLSKNDRFSFFLDIKFNVHTENGIEDIVEAIGLSSMHLESIHSDVEFSSDKKQGTIAAIFNKRFIESYQKEKWKIK